MPHSDTGSATGVTAAALAFVEAARGRADRATPGPWELDGLGVLESYAEGEDQGYICQVDPDLWISDETAEFIAHSRADVPLLAAIAEAGLALRAALDTEDHPRICVCRTCKATAPFDAAIRAAGEAGT